MQIRTDLAVEWSEEHTETAGISQSDCERGNARLSVICVENETAAQLIGRPMGRYVTLELPKMTDDEQVLSEAAELLCEQITEMLPNEGTVLVVGLGNRYITPDTIGTLTARQVLATRHIRGELARSVGLSDLRPTVVLTPGVTGQTGAETGELVRAVCRELNPSAVIAVDALASGSLARLGRTVQLCDAGIAPGSGVGNNRKALTKQLLGVPVLGIGVPTVVDARNMAVELTGCYEEDLIAPDGTQMMITPREIDLLVQRAARLLALAINGALQPAYSAAELIQVARE